MRIKYDNSQFHELFLFFVLDFELILICSGLEKKVHSERFFCTEYEKSKVAADKIALNAASEGVPIILLYPGVLYGPGKLTSGNMLAKLV